MKRYPTTPQSVIDAIHVVASYLRDIEAAEAVISPTGGAGFHLERHADRLLSGWGAERDALNMRIAELEATLRLIRRRIESEEKPGEWTAEIYQATGAVLPY